jgi:RimJ/RimL family protein N-acetyltransferase
MQQTAPSENKMASDQPLVIHPSRRTKPAWALPVEKGQPDPLNFSPSVAHHLSSLIMQHWYACLAAKEIRADAPLDILDFCPGSGLTTLLITQVLQKRLPQMAGLRWRYLPVVWDRKAIAAWRSLEGLQTQISAGKLVPLLWHPERDDPCLLLLEGRQAWNPVNPVIVLTHDHFSRLPHRLLAVHYGKLMEYADDVSSPHAEAEDTSQRDEGRRWIGLDYQSLDSDLHGLFELYLAKFNSAPVPYPEGALRLIHVVSQKCARGCLLVSSAQGTTTETQLRLANFPDLTKIFQSQQALPVNFHLLSQKMTHCRAATGHVSLQKDQVIQLALFHHGDADERLSGLLHDIDPGMFGHASALSQAMQGVAGDSAFEHRLTLLKLSAFDPKVLAAIHIPNFSKACKSSTFNRKAWQQALDQVWANFLPIDDKDIFHEQLAMMAMHCGHWSLARRALQSGLLRRGNNPTDLAQLAWCYARTGQLKKAAQQVAEALVLEPRHELGREVSHRIENRLSQWNSVWRQPVHHPDQPLILEPLDSSHAEAMLHQYRDPQIAIMTGLPAITTIESMHQWIDEQLGEEQWAHFAIMHSDHGFVGYINLAISGHAAFFCFWTGVDFQGRGWATIAGKLACDFAEKTGITVLLTSAYTDNQRSIRALERIGFSEIPIRAMPPDHERIFYILKSPVSANVDVVFELKDYYIREKISLEFPTLQNEDRR